MDEVIACYTLMYYIEKRRKGNVEISTGDWVYKRGRDKDKINSR